jgi:hypothetical protein
MTTMYPFSLLTLLLFSVPVQATPTVRPTDIAPVAYQICAEVAIELQSAVELGIIPQSTADHVNFNCLTSDFSDYNF